MHVYSLMCQSLRNRLRSPNHSAQATYIHPQDMLGINLSNLPPISMIEIWGSKSLLLCCYETMPNSTNENSMILPLSTFSLLSQEEEKGGYIQ